MAGELRIVAFPRDPNPYQELLYGPMRALGDEVRYAAELTGSRTLNLLLLPFELMVLRLRGYQVFHLHWTFGFTFPSLAVIPGSNRLGRLWFQLVLRVLAMLRLRTAWTAHNVLPHDPIFDDDLAARRRLVAASSLVIAHSPHTLEALAELGISPRHSVVIPQGPTVLPGLDAVAPVRAHTPRRVTFVGRVTRYKGVEDLIASLRDLDVRISCRVAGACDDPELAVRLQDAARDLDDRLSLELGYVEDESLVQLLEESDVIVFPFRSITTSSSVMLALAGGRPVIIPNLPQLADIPQAAAFRYAPGVNGLRAALRDVAGATEDDLRAHGAAAREVSASRSWSVIAGQTHRAFVQMCSSTHEPQILAS